MGEEGKMKKDNFFSKNLEIWRKMLNFAKNKVYG